MPRELAITTELRAGLRRVLAALARQVEAQRQAGRGSAGDDLRGVAIEPGDAEQLLADIGSDLAASHVPAAPMEIPPAAPAPADESPIRRAARVFQLDAAGVDVLMLCLGVELDGRFARLVAFLNDHVARTRPTTELALSLFASAQSAVGFAEAPAVRWRLLLLEGDGPMSERTLRVAPELLVRLSMPHAAAPRLAGIRGHEDAPASVDELPLAANRRAALRHWARASASREGARARIPIHVPLPALVLAGRPGSGRATAVCAAAREAGRGVVETTWATDRGATLEAAAREALWADAVLLVRVPLAATEDALEPLWEALGRWPVSIALALNPDALEAAIVTAPSGALAWAIEPPTTAWRESLWRRLLQAEPAPGAAEVSASQLAELAERYDFVPGLVVASLRRAGAEIGDADGRLDFAALSRACRAVGSARMGTIAQRLALPYTREHLVVPADLNAELDLAIAWVRNRRQVFERWKFGQRIALGRGMTALFAGGSGTGKTMAAQVLARELGLDLFRVDLSRVMSKYIGETEKNLSQLFDDAAASGAVLFFDEADALFGKRSEVKDAHDRYANLEISYLLQRMEEHEGVSLLATNRMGDLDEAFTRRFHFILDFPMPRAPERRRIWQGMLPLEAERDDSVSLDTLADDYEMSGGEIRNSVLSAAFAAAAEGVPIGLRHLKRGLRRELLKTGRVLDSEQRQTLAE